MYEKFAIAMRRLLEEYDKCPSKLNKENLIREILAQFRNDCASCPFYEAIANPDSLHSK